MAKKQTFADKSKAKDKAGITVKVIKTIKNEKGNYKFLENYVKIDDIGQVSTLK